MYICEECGNYTENWCEGRCDFCYGDLVEAKTCKNCGEWSSKEICDRCLENEMTLNNVVEYSRKCGHGYEIELPDFFEIYNDKEIEEILIKHILSTTHKEQRNVKEYCKNDIDCFSDFIKDKFN